MGSVRVAYDDDLLRAGYGGYCNRGGTTRGTSIVAECTHRIRPAGSWGAVCVPCWGIQGIHTSRCGWCGRPSRHHHGGVASVMELSAGCGMADDLPNHALHLSWNACRVAVDPRRYRDARIAAASFPLSIPIVAFGCCPPVGADNSERRLTRGSNKGVGLLGWK